MLLLLLVKFVLYLSYEKNKNKQKEAGFGSFKERNDYDGCRQETCESQVFVFSISCQTFIWSF